MLIYDGVKDPDYFERVEAALASYQGVERDAVGAVAEQLRMSKAAVRAVRTKLKKMSRYSLVLLNKGGVTVPVADVRSAKGFRSACAAAVKRFPGTLKHLELPDWLLTDGSDRVHVHEITRPAGGR